MTDEETFKQQLNRYFTAVVDDEYRRHYGDKLEDVPNGTPIFYDRNGDLRSEDIARQAGLQGAEGIRIIEESYEAWVAAGNRPPTVRVSRPSARASSASVARDLSMPAVNVELDRDEPRRSFVDETRDEMRDAIEFRRLEREFQAETGNSGFQPPQVGSGQDAIMVELIRALAQGNSGSKSMSPEMMMLMKQNNDMRQDGTQQLMAMFNAMNQSTMGWMQVMTADRDRGSHTAIESKIMDHALQGLFTKPESPEESVWSDLIRSGQLPEIGRGLMEGLGGVMGALRPPTGAPPYAPQAKLAEPAPGSFVPNVPEIVIPESEPAAPTYHEKCSVVMERLHSTLPPDWQASGEVMELLARVVEIAVRRAEDAHPADVSAQLEYSDKEVVLIANLRTIGLGIDRIAKGEVTVEIARSVLQSQPIYPMLVGENYDSLMGIVEAYSGADNPQSPSLRYDIEYLRKPTARAIVNDLLAGA